MAMHGHSVGADWAASTKLYCISSYSTKQNNRLHFIIIIITKSIRSHRVSFFFLALTMADLSSCCTSSSGDSISSVSSASTSVHFELKDEPDSFKIKTVSCTKNGKVIEVHQYIQPPAIDLTHESNSDSSQFALTTSKIDSRQVTPASFSCDQESCSDSESSDCSNFL